MTTPGQEVWRNATMAALFFAIDPVGLGGICLRARPGPVRDAWLSQLRAMLPPETAIRRVPLHIADDRLLGGLDLAATLRAGRPVAERGLLAESDGGVLLLAMGERLSAAKAARLTACLDAGEVVVERDGIGRRFPCRAGMVVLDEGNVDDERPPAALADRCAFLVDLSAVAVGDAKPGDWMVRSVPGWRKDLPHVETDDDTLEALAAAAAALGVASPRALLFALRAARASATLDDSSCVTEHDAEWAARLVLAPRATMLPQPAPEPQEPEKPEAGEEEADGNAEGDDTAHDQELEDLVLEAAKAAIPAGLLAALESATRPGHAAAAGRAGAPKQGQRRGRPIGTRRGELTAGARLNVVETLRAAAPWQKLRRAASPDTVARVLVRSDDFRITRFQQRTESTAIFVVDASGSAALNRLAEAKGAVELLLADCYVRRDQVALLSFRGAGATLLLPPTSSLVRAKRGLAGLAGGGGTPLAAAIDQAAALADQVRRRGQTPFIVLLTDGRANVARDGAPGRARAAEDAQAAARTIRAGGFAALLIDTSPQPQPQGKALAAEMGATYLPLPYADATVLSQAVEQERQGVAAHRP